MLGLSKSRDGRYRRPGSNQAVASRARGAWPHGPSRGAGALAPGQLSGRTLACAGGAVCCGKEAGPWPDWPIRGTRALARGQCPGRKLACAGGAVCCGKETKKAPAKPPARTCVIVLHKRERQLAAPRREETAQALGRGRAFTSRSGASVSSPPQGANRSAGAPAADVRHRLDQARRKPPLQGANCSAGAPAADVRHRLDQARASARRPKARIAPREHPPRTCSFLSIRRERQLAAPRREETAEALRLEISVKMCYNRFQ